MSQIERPNPYKCPVCNARFRGSTTCSRCGTDLTLLMRTAATAAILRRNARAALIQGDLAKSFAQEVAANRLVSTQ